MVTIKLRRLQIFRTLFCFSLFFAYAFNYMPFREAYRAEIFRPWLRELLVAVGIAPTTYFYFVFSMLLISLILAGLGLYLRWSLMLAMIFTVAMDFVLFSTGIYPMTDLSFFVLVALWLSAVYYDLDRYSFPLVLNRTSTEVPFLTLRMVHFVLGGIYLNAFLNKILLGSNYWFNGITLQTFLATRGAFIDNPLASFLGQSPNLCIFLAVSTVVLEGGFLFAMFNPLTRIIFAVIGLLFHLLTLIIFEVNFLWFYFPAYLVFIDVDWILSFIHKSESN